MKKIFKKSIAVLLAVILLIPALAVSANDIKVVVNGTPVDFTGDQPPIIKDGRTLVPVRKVFEQLGSDVAISYNPDNQMIILTKGITNVSLIIGNPFLTIAENNESWNIAMDTVPIIENGRTLLPARYVAEAIGAKVSWDNNTRTVLIDSDYTVVGGYVGNAQLSIVSRNALYGCIDRNRKIVLPIEYHSIDFNEFSRTKNSAQSDNFNNVTYAIAKVTKLDYAGNTITSYVGIVREHTDSSGKVIPSRVDEFDLVEPVLEKSNFVYVQKNGKWGIVDASGNTAIPAEYDERPVPMTYLGAPRYKVKKNGLYGISTLDNGKLITEIKYTVIGSTDFATRGTPVTYYQEGYVCAMRDTLFGYIDIDGNEVYPFGFMDVKPLQNGKAKVLYNGEKKNIQIVNGSIRFLPDDPE